MGALQPYPCGHLKRDKTAATVSPQSRFSNDQALQASAIGKRNKNGSFRMARMELIQ
jgi:hypothetical protein